MRDDTQESTRRWPPKFNRRDALLLLTSFGLGVSAGYVAWGKSFLDAVLREPVLDTVGALVQGPSGGAPNPLPESYTIPATFGEVGPQLLVAGAIDYEQFSLVYQRAGQPLTAAQNRILTAGSDEQIVIDESNAYFLLNFFWALGLINRNPILLEGPMFSYADGEIGRFASTGGWTVGASPAAELFASTPIVSLSAAQQARLEMVADAVYRPCCNNPTSFPDCNHGMAMLGLLALMAAGDASAEELFQAAKYANRFWFPQQTHELAVFLHAAYGRSFDGLDADQAVGVNLASQSGFTTVRQWLVENDRLEKSGGGSSCGV